MQADHRSVLGDAGHFSEAIFVGDKSGGKAVWAMSLIEPRTEETRSLSTETLPVGFCTEKQMCLGFFQSADIKMISQLGLRANPLGVSNMNVVPYVMVLTASKEVAAAMEKARYVMEECVDSNGVLRLAGFLPLDLFLKWYVVDPTGLGVLRPKHRIAREHSVYQFRSAMVEQIAQNWQSTDWMVATNSGKHQFGSLAKDLQYKTGVQLLRNSYAVKTSGQLRAVPQESPLASQVPSKTKATKDSASKSAKASQSDPGSRSKQLKCTFCKVTSVPPAFFRLHHHKIPEKCIHNPDGVRYRPNLKNRSTSRST